MKRQLIALSMVILMVASVCAVAATTASAATPTTFPIATSIATPMVNTPFTITGQLMAGATKLDDRPVHLESHKKRADGTWTDWANLAGTYKRTDGNGKVSSTRPGLTTAGAREYRWHYNGSTTYAAVRSSPPVMVTAYTGATTLSFNEPPMTLHVNTWQTLTGYLKDEFGTPLPGRSVGIYWWNPGESPSLYGTVTTDGTGKWRAVYNSPGPGVIYFYAKFNGGTYNSIQYKASQSKTWGIAVDTKIPTGLTLSMPSTASLDSSITITGRLTDFHGHPLGHMSLSGKWRETSTQGSTGWANLGPISTDYNGNYKTTFSTAALDYPGTLWINITKNADSTYAGSTANGHAVVS